MNRRMRGPHPGQPPRTPGVRRGRKAHEAGEVEAVAGGDEPGEGNREHGVALTFAAVCRLDRLGPDGFWKYQLI